MNLRLLDVFGKTSDDARVRTSSGGVVSLLAFALLGWLLLDQFLSYWAFKWEHKMVVDSSRGQRMTVYLDISFPHLPCELLNVDNIDETGDFQQDLDDALIKTDLDAQGNVLDPNIRKRQISERDAAIAARPVDYEGSCYGAEAGIRLHRELSQNEEVKCMSCEDLHLAYSTLNWKFDDGSGFSQCQEEKYPDHLRENKNNGCRVTGMVRVQKVAGQLHFAPGESHFVSDRHSHDLSTYNLDDLPYNFAHKIHELQFGGSNLESNLASGAHISTHEDGPLKNYAADVKDKQWQFKYYVKVVGTDILYLNGKQHNTNQYSVTHHERPLKGGRDSDHPHSYHKSGGIPGIWLQYDISPMKILKVEARQQSFGALIMNVFAIIGAVITTAAMVDKGVYAVDQVLKSRKNQ